MDTVILLHGFLGVPSSWQAVTGLLPPRLRIVAPALPGHGDVAPAPSDFEAEVERLASLLLSLDGPLHLAGHSLGAGLAVGLLVRHPELYRRGLLQGATLIAPCAGLEDGAARRRQADADEAWARRLEREGVGAVLDAWLAQPSFAGLAERVDAGVLEEERTRRLAHRPERLAQALRVLGEGRMPCYLGALSELDLPVALVVGELDRAHLALAGEMMTRLPLATLHTLPQCGHDVLLEAPDGLAHILMPLQEFRSGEVSSASLSLEEIHAELRAQLAQGSGKGEGQSPGQGLAQTKDQERRS